MCIVKIWTIKRVNRTAGTRPFGRVSFIRHMLHSINSLEAPAAGYTWRYVGTKN